MSELRRARSTSAARSGGNGPHAPLGEFAYDSVKTRIIRGDVAPGIPVREADLVREMGVSRTPIREALRRLQAEGLLTPGPRGGYLVVDWDREEMQEVYEVRIALERLAVRGAALLHSRVDMAELADTLDEIRAAADGQLDSLPALNFRFHLIIARASGNSYLHGLLQSISEIFHRYRTAELTLAARRKAALREHEQILSALTARDPDLAERIVQEHLARGMSALLGEIGAASGRQSKTSSRARPAATGRR